ncbi:MAG: cyclophilin-like fold protein [Candidatus Omnitrophica bacterium]|nr:cyclophilin-like fold protein [Candidatus Omnitrophota bacterium]
MLIVFKAKNIGFYVKLNDSPAAAEISCRLPVEGAASRWGDEIYFETDISAPADGQTMDVQVGDVAYWPQGKCICVFFGRTEASKTDKPVPASPVVVIGHTLATPGELREINAGEAIRVFVMGKSQNYSQGLNPYEDSRKLSQQEIDILVKQLLEEKGSAR